MMGAGEGIDPEKLLEAMTLKTSEFTSRVRAIEVAQKEGWGKVWTDPYVGDGEMARDVILVTDRDAVYSLRRSNYLLRWVPLYPETMMESPEGR